MAEWLQVAFYKRVLSRLWRLLLHTATVHIRSHTATVHEAAFLILGYRRPANTHFAFGQSPISSKMYVGYWEALQKLYRRNLDSHYSTDLPSAQCALHMIHLVHQIDVSDS